MGGGAGLALDAHRIAQGEVGHRGATHVHRGRAGKERDIVVRNDNKNRDINQFF